MHIEISPNRPEKFQECAQEDQAIHHTSKVLASYLPATSSSSLVKEKDKCICVISPDPSCTALLFVCNICFPCLPADTASWAFELEKAWMMIQKISEPSYQLLTQANVTQMSNHSSFFLVNAFLGLCWVVFWIGVLSDLGFKYELEFQEVMANK